MIILNLTVILKVILQLGEHQKNTKRIINIFLLKTAFLFVNAQSCD